MRVRGVLSSFAHIRALPALPGAAPKQAADVTSVEEICLGNNSPR